MDALFSTVIPVVYIITLGVLFNMTMTDDYLTDNTAQMYEGVGPVSINGLDKYRVERWAAVMRMLSPPIVFFAFFAASMTYGRVKAIKKRAASQEKRRSQGGQGSQGKGPALTSTTASSRNTASRNSATTGEPKMMSQGV